MNRVSAFFGIIRLPFLLLTPVCVFLGLGMVVYAGKSFDIVYALLALAGALCTHVSVNAANEYFDFRSGLDEKTTKTPFSGGSGTLQAHPELAGAALAIALISFAITIVVGIFFCFTWGFAILPIGIIGLLLIAAYTPLLTRHPVLCLIAPGLGFGLLMVTGSYFALTGEYSPGVILASLVPFFLVNNLLLLNQFPDAEADARTGRRHLPITAGLKTSGKIFAIFLSATYLVIATGVVLGMFSIWSLLGLLTIPLAIPVFIGVLSGPDTIEKTIPLQGLNVILNLLTPLLMGIGLFIR